MSKYIVFKVRDGSIWGIPAEVIAKSRASYYATRGLGSYAELYAMEYDNTMDDDLELTDWAGNNMDWDELKPHLMLIKEARPINDRDYRDGWENAILATIEKEDEA